MALPDRWVSWVLGAVPAGLRLIRKYRPQVLWSTHPIATAHLVGFILHRLTNIPWVADFRDSMLEDEYPADGLTRWSYQWVEKKVIKYGSRLIFTTESARRMYLNRYSKLPHDRCQVIPNGYDEEDFSDLRLPEPFKNFNDHPIRLLHAGVIYPGERDPRHFFMALSRLKKDHRADPKNLTIDLRASGSETYYSKIIQELEIDDLVHLLPALPYRQALQDCVDADGLLLFQAASCNHLIPAKVYEYLRLRKPILAFTDDRGDTAIFLRKMGGATIADLADEQAIYLILPHFLELVKKGAHPLPDGEKIQYYARKNQALELARCLSGL
jgi:glycosyltransferase involved in cell wall biosynthesis